VRCSRITIQPLSNTEKSVGHITCGAMAKMASHTMRAVRSVSVSPSERLRTLGVSTNCPSDVLRST
jgi:hypothetical protein